MRATAERKAETRERILAAAGDLFRAHGVDGVGVDAIMHRAGLTHGGFYAHFPSKEALVAEVSAASLARAAARWERISHETDPATALARIVQSYLDPAHVAAVEHGCVLTTLGPDIARREDARPAITAAIRRMVDALAHCLPERRRRKRALAALSTLVGAVVLARLCDDGQLAEELLAAAEETAGKAAAR
ncbi:MAG TPA: TetR/AcrR family transcriptional regulator [Acetobacteraceae bacterium]|jgi:TetR/AcrR family transcriptional repressor of nem operon|nr:TetR/AcrR family transcriptional regulator [Acetobacteraceae bacterium]